MGEGYIFSMKKKKSIVAKKHVNNSYSSFKDKGMSRSYLEYDDSFGMIIKLFIH